MIQKLPKSVPGRHARQSPTSTHSLVPPGPCTFGSRISQTSLSPLLTSRERTLTSFGRTSTTRPWRSSSRQSSDPQPSSPSIIILEEWSSSPSIRPSEASAGSSPRHVKMANTAPPVSDPSDGTSVRVATRNQKSSSMGCFGRYVPSECTSLELLIWW